MSGTEGSTEMTSRGGNGERVVSSLTTTVTNEVEMVRSPPAGVVAVKDPPESPDRSTLTVSLSDAM